MEFVEKAWDLVYTDARIPLRGHAWVCTGRLLTADGGADAEVASQDMPGYAPPPPGSEIPVEWLPVRRCKSPASSQA